MNKIKKILLVFAIILIALFIFKDKLGFKASSVYSNPQTDTIKRSTNESRINVEGIAFRKAVELPKKRVKVKGKIKVALAKVKEINEKDIFISSGVPFAPGQLKSEKDFALLDKNGEEIPIATKILARWPQDQSIRSVLVQLKYPIEHIYEYVYFKWGEKRAKVDLDIVDPNWKFPQGIIIMPPEWLCYSQVIGEQIPLGKTANGAYDYNIIKEFPKVIKVAKTGNLRIDGYYSSAHVYYQLYVRTGEMKYFIEARKELLYYRENEIRHEGKYRGAAKIATNVGRYVYVQALCDDYLLTGDPRSLKIVGYMAEFLKNNFPASKAFYPKKANNFWTERYMAFPFLGIISYYELTQDKEYLKVADEYMKNLHKTQLEWPGRGGFIHNLYSHDPEEGARRDEYGGSPFMTGLLLEAIIKYHKITGSDIAADSIFRALDWLINEGLIDSGDSFKYLTADKYSDSEGFPDLNLLVVHAFGYGYRLSGYQREDYLEVSQKIFNRGVKDAYLGKRKHFNQNYRSSGHYLAYIKDGLKLRADKNFTNRLQDEQKLEQKIKSIFYSENFENSHGKFKTEGDSSLSLDSNIVYLNGKSLNVKSKYAFSFLSAGVKLDRWSIDDYPTLTFSYNIPEGVPVGMRVKTRFEDWICIGGTSAYKCDNAKVPVGINLISDGTWHNASLDMPSIIRTKLEGIEILSAFEFYTGGNAKANDQFWIDDFIIKK